MSDDQSSFADKRQQWLTALRGDDPHSIFHQLIQMTWDAAAFRVVNEARRLALPTENGGVQLNGLMHRLLDRGFFISQVVAVRRLNDSYSLEGTRSVYSLSGLLKDMIKYRHLMTRQAIFKAKGLEYDYEPIKRKSYEYSLQQREAGESAHNVPRALAWSRHESCHERIDRLAGTEASNRQPMDVVSQQVLVNLRDKVSSACNEIITYANKRIAHAATPASRGTGNVDDQSLSLDTLWTAQKHLSETAGFLSIYILGDSCCSFLPTPQYDQFMYIERALIEAKDIRVLENLWRKLDDESHTWSQWGLDDYEREFRL